MYKSLLISILTLILMILSFLVSKSFIAYEHATIFSYIYLTGFIATTSIFILEIIDASKNNGTSKARLNSLYIVIMIIASIISFMLFYRVLVNTSPDKEEESYKILIEEQSNMNYSVSGEIEEIDNNEFTSDITINNYTTSAIEGHQYDIEPTPVTRNTEEYDEPDSDISAANKTTFSNLYFKLDPSDEDDFIEVSIANKITIDEEFIENNYSASDINNFFDSFSSNYSIEVLEMKQNNADLELSISFTNNTDTDLKYTLYDTESQETDESDEVYNIEAGNTKEFNFILDNVYRNREYAFNITSTYEIPII